MYFTEAEVADLYEGLAEAEENYRELRQRFVRRAFQTDGAREHADQGFGRRLGNLFRGVERVFEILPPERDDIPKRNETIDATLTIQAFVMNAFGCCENLAWIWVLEKDLRQPNGRALPQGWVGLGPSYETVRGSFSQAFCDYLETRRRWFDHLKGFRDALAHRIPLYIPPFTVTPEDGNQWAALGAQADAALIRGDLALEERLRSQRMALARFQPIMTHSLSAGAPVAIFHAQLLADFSTIHELGGEFLSELDR